MDRSPPSPRTPVVDLEGVESSTNELPLSALTFGAGAGAGGGGSWPRGLEGDASAGAAGRRQRHSIAGQMTYLKMLGLGARGKLSAAGLFSTAVISGSSSAPNLRVMIPTTASNNAALEGFGGVPAIRPLETLHNALSLRQLDAFLERMTAAPVTLGTPPNAATQQPPKQPSPTNSVGWSGPSSLMSSSGELPSALSSAGPSSPNSTCATSEHKTPSESSAWSRAGAGAGPWEAAAAGGGEAAPAPRAAPPSRPPSLAGSSIGGDVTPVSLASELEFNSNEATAGSITDHDLLSAEGEDDEETLSADTCGSPMRIIKNDLSPLPLGISHIRLDNSQQSHTSKPAEFYGLNLQQSKETFYKDVPSSSKNFNLENEMQKCDKTDTCLTKIESISVHNKDGNKNKKNDLLNNGSRRYSDGSAHKSNVGSNVSRFKTTLVTEDSLRPGTSTESSSNNNRTEAGPSVTKARDPNVKPGFTITES